MQFFGNKGRELIESILVTFAPGDKHLRDLGGRGRGHRDETYHTETVAENAAVVLTLLALLFALPNERGIVDPENQPELMPRVSSWLSRC